jgi:ATP-dependent RNA helicase DeaD
MDFTPVQGRYDKFNKEGRPGFPKGGPGFGEGRPGFGEGRPGRPDGEGPGKFQKEKRRKGDGFGGFENEGREGAPQGKLFLNIGKFQGARPKDILGALAGETGLPGNTFGDIQVFPKHTLVEIPEERMDEVLKSFKRVRIKGIPVIARRAEF